MYAKQTSGFSMFCMFCMFCGSSKQIMGLEKANCCCYCDVIGDSKAFLSVATAQSRGCVLVGIAVSAFAGEVCAGGSTVLLHLASALCAAVIFFSSY